MEPDNNTGWYLDSFDSPNFILHEMTGTPTTGSGDSADFTNFPGNLGLDMAHGVVVLDQYMFVGTTNGQIHNKNKLLYITIGDF